MNRRKYLMTMAGVSSILIAGCSEEEGEVDGDGSDSGNNDDETVVVHDYELSSDAVGDAVINGEATNELGSEETIYMEATFYDANDTLLDDGISDRIEEVPDGQRFRFEILSTVDYQEVDDYDLEWSTGF